MRLVFYRTDTGGDRPAARKVLAVEVAPKPPGGLALTSRNRARVTYWREFADFFEIV